MGTFLSGTGILGWVLWCGVGIPCTQDIPPGFYPPHVDVGLPIQRLHASVSPPLRVSTPPTSLNECDFFNSLVVRLPYSLIF